MALLLPVETCLVLLAQMCGETTSPMKVDRGVCRCQGRHVNLMGSQVDDNLLDQTRLQIRVCVFQRKIFGETFGYVKLIHGLQSPNQPFINRIVNRMREKRLIRSTALRLRCEFSRSREYCKFKPSHVAFLRGKYAL